MPLPLPAHLVLRPITPVDREFLLHIYTSTRAEELAAVPWSDAQKAAFIAQQFHAQSVDYHAKYPDASFQLLLLRDLPIGRLYVHRDPAQIHILDIAILPEHRGQGLGSLLLRALIDEARPAHKNIHIYVEKFNRAQHLYRRLGFHEIEDTGVYWQMRWPAAPSSRESSDES